MANRAKYHYELAQCMVPYGGNILETSQIKAIFTRAWPGLNVAFVQPSDHCDTYQNVEMCEICGGKSNAIFSKLDRALYRVRLGTEDYRSLYIVAEPCIGTKDHACVDVCPVECFYEGEDMLYIHPDECIGCGACLPECPVAAIFDVSDVPEQWTGYIAKNANAFMENPNIPKAPTREEWEEMKKNPRSEAAKYYRRYPPLS